MINASWGGPAGRFNCAALEDAIRVAGSQNILFVAAAGNDGTDNDVLTIQPASFRLENLIAVAATDENDQRAIFNETQSSNFGDERVQIAAPGKDVVSTINSNYAMLLQAFTGHGGDGFAPAQGTSFAAPHVSGVAALLLSRHPGLTPGELKTAIVLGGDQLASLQGIVLQGRRLNAAGALVASDSVAGSDLWVCDDGIDNDGDGLVDFPDDSECSAVFPDASEATPGVCGLGFELAFLLPLLLGLHTRRRRMRARFSGFGLPGMRNRRPARWSRGRVEDAGGAPPAHSSGSGTRRRTSFRKIAGEEHSMTSNIGQRGRTAGTTLSIALAAAVLTLVASSALATPVTLVGIAFSRDGGPIGPNDSIVIGAVSLEVLFPHSVSTALTVTVLEESFEIRMQIVTQPAVGFVFPAVGGVGASEEVGPLAPGTYDVTVEWQHIGDPGVLLDSAKDHGTGAFSFTVVPEPTSAALLAAGMAALLVRARRAGRRCGAAPGGTQADFS